MLLTFNTKAQLVWCNVCLRDTQFTYIYTLTLIIANSAATFNVRGPKAYCSITYVVGMTVLCYFIASAIDSINISRDVVVYNAARWRADGTEAQLALFLFFFSSRFSVPQLLFIYVALNFCRHRISGPTELAPDALETVAVNFASTAEDNRFFVRRRRTWVMYFFDGSDLLTSKVFAYFFFIPGF